MSTHDASALDAHITADLALLGAASKAALPTIDETFAGIDSIGGGAYRDGTAGAEARRDQLLASRRLELALMPLSTGRVFVHRVARIAAGATAAIAALFIILIVADPVLLSLLGFFIPDLTLSLIIVGTLSAALAAYVLSGLIAERVFDRRMRAALETSGDAFEDIDALARGPLGEMRALTTRLDAWSTALPLLGVATCAPLFAFLSLIYMPQLASGFGRASTYRIASNGWMASNLAFVLIAIAVSAVAIAIIGRACRREQRRGERSALLARLGHWSIIPMAIVFGLVVMVFLGRSVTALALGTFPSANMRAFVAIGGTLALLAPVTWIALTLRRAEQARLQGPTP